MAELPKLSIQKEILSFILQQFKGYRWHLLFCVCVFVIFFSVLMTHSLTDGMFVYCSWEYTNEL